MAINNDRNNKGQFPVGSVVKYDFTAPADTRWLLTNGASVSKTTYAPLYALQGNAYEGTGNLTQTGALAGDSGKFPYCVRWHPSSNYIGYCGTNTAKQLAIASFDGSTLTDAATVDLGNDGAACSWSPNGSFLAVGIYTSHLVKVFSWNGSNSLTQVCSIDTTYDPYSLEWHPNGNFLAIGHATGGSDELSVWSWNGSNTLTQVATINLTSYATCLSWSKSGTYLAAGVAEASKPEVQIYSWNGSNTLTYICNYTTGVAGGSNDMQWAPDDSFVAFGASGAGPHLEILSFDGSALTTRASIDYGTSLGAHLRWSKGGNYLATAIYNTQSTVDTVFLYAWVASTYTLTQVDTIQLIKYGGYGIDFNYTNNYIAYSTNLPSGAPYNKLYAGTTGLTSNDYRTNFLLQTTASSIIRGA